MSNLKVTNIQHASAASPAIVLAADGSATAQVSSLNGGPLSGARNRIINGDMRIDQRNGGASVTPTDGQYTLDRWLTRVSQASKITIQRSSTAPSGFSNSLLVTTSSAYSISASDFFSVSQYVEGFNFADFAWGTASASAVTISFWVRSSLAGTFGGSIRNNAENRAYPFSYTISTANTWEYKTIVITGDTSGTWVGSTNGRGALINWSLGTGSTFSATAGSWTAGNILSSTGTTSLVATNGATFYITGVQLEAGTVATPFERRSYGQELALCQRYAVVYKADATYTSLNIGAGFTNSATAGFIGVSMPVPMRVYPSITVSSAAHFVFGAPVSGTISTIVATVTAGQFDADGSQIRLDVTGSGFTIGGTLLRANSASAKLTFSSEL